jgi:hypothetical protein
MAELFQTTSDNVGLHIKSIYAEGELAESATAKDFSVVQNEGLGKRPEWPSPRLRCDHRQKLSE